MAEQMERWQELLAEHQKNNDLRTARKLCDELRNSIELIKERILVLEKRNTEFSDILLVTPISSDLYTRISVNLAAIGEERVEAIEKRNQLEDLLERYYDPEY